MKITKRDLGKYFYTIEECFDKEGKLTHKRVLKGKLFVINVEKKYELDGKNIKEKSYTTVWLDLTKEPNTSKNYWYREHNEIYRTLEKASKAIKYEE
jgi:hypothetical protein